MYVKNVYLYMYHEWYIIYVPVIFINGFITMFTYISIGIITELDFIDHYLLGFWIKYISIT